MESPNFIRPKGARPACALPTGLVPHMRVSAKHRRQRLLIVLATAGVFLGMAWSAANGLSANAGPMAVLRLLPYLVGLAAAILAGKKRPVTEFAFSLATGVYWLLAVGNLLGKSQPAHQLIEHAAQLLMPFLCWMLVFRGWQNKRPPELLMAVALSLAFVAHGLYALGWPHAVPGHFLAMTQRAFGLGPGDAQTLLRVAGTLDLSVALAIWLPGVQRAAAVYMIAWGFLTAWARPWVHLDSAGGWEAFWLYGDELLVRAPHYLLPAALLLVPGRAFAQIGAD